MMMNASSLQQCVISVVLRALSEDASSQEVKQIFDPILKNRNLDPFLGVILEKTVSFQPATLSDSLLAILLSGGIHLKNLKLRKCTNVSMAGLAMAFKCQPNIEHLDLSECNQLAYSSIAGVLARGTPNLKSLIFESCQNMKDSTVQAILKSCSHLTFISLACNTSLTDGLFCFDTKNPVEKTLISTPLKGIDISGCSGISTTTIRQLVDFCGPSLKNINISWTNTDCIALVYLAGYSLSSAVYLATSTSLGNAPFTARELENAQNHEFMILQNRHDYEKNYGDVQNARSSSSLPVDTLPSPDPEFITENVTKGACKVDCSQTNQINRENINEQMYRQAGDCESLTSSILPATVLTASEKTVRTCSLSCNLSDIFENMNKVYQSKGPMPISNDANTVSDVCKSGHTLKVSTRSEQSSFPTEKDSTNIDRFKGLGNDNSNATRTDSKCNIVDLGIHEEDAFLDELQLPTSIHCSTSNIDSKIKSLESLSASLPCDSATAEISKESMSSTSLPPLPNSVDSSDDKVTNTSCAFPGVISRTVSASMNSLGDYVDESSSSKSVHYKSDVVDLKRREDPDFTSITGPKDSISTVILQSSGKLNTDFQEKHHDFTSDSTASSVSTIDSSGSEVTTLSSPVKKSIDLPPSIAHEIKETCKVRETPHFIKDDYSKAYVPRPLFNSKVTELDISEVKFFEYEVGINCLKMFVSSNHDLLSLNISWKSLDDGILGLIAENEPELTCIGLVDCESLSNSGLKSLGKYCKKLRRVDLQGVPFVDDEGLATIVENGVLEKLSLAECAVTDVTLRRIAKYCSFLIRELDLSWCENLTDKGIAHLIRCCPRLRTLNLRHCNASTQTTKALEENGDELTFLGLCSIQEITNIMAIKFLRNMKNLNFIDLSWNCLLTDETISTLFASCTLLVEVVLSGLKRITSKPFLPIISGVNEWRSQREIIINRIRRRNIITRDYGIEEKYEPDFYLPHRSIHYAPNLQKINVSFSDKINDTHLAEIVSVCRGTLKIDDYYSMPIKPRWTT